MNHLRKMANRAFTLIELLVVIAIIAILAAILFPVFAQAKLAAKKAVDLSNTKQIMTSVLIYNNDYDDMYPLENYKGHVIYIRWSSKNVLGPYLKNTQIFKSPVESLNTSGIPDTYYALDGLQRSQDEVNSYSANGLTVTAVSQVFDPAEPAPQIQQGLFGDGGYAGCGQTAQAAPCGATNGSQIAYPSDLLAISTGGSDSDKLVGVPNTSAVELVYEDEDLWNTEEAADCFTDGQYHHHQPVGVYREFNGMANYVQADGHAKSFKPDHFYKEAGTAVYLNQKALLINPADIP